MTDWFTRWFGKEYLELYPHRDDADAREAVSMIRAQIGGAQFPAPILDLACGSGRHSRALWEWGWTVGLDLSATLLQLAHEEDPDDPYVRGDMRVLPFAPGTFGLVVNLFTSFGYFATDAEHLEVIREVARVTKSGGTFVLDYLNADEVRRTLVPFDEHVVDGRRIWQRRSISADDRYVEKNISADHCDREYQERVRLYTPDNLRDMIASSGFVVRHEFGDYDRSALTPDSPRVIFFAERT